MRTNVWKRGVVLFWEFCKMVVMGDGVKVEFNLSRPKYFGFILIAIGLGLFSRTSYTPKLIYPYIGDVFYSLMFFFIVGFVKPSLCSKKVALIAVGYCFFIELTQLYQADWLNNIRSYRLGALILGYGFLWSDLVCYLIGGICGVVFEKLLKSESLI
jgi:hypothetical protein